MKLMNHAFIGLCIAFIFGVILGSYFILSITAAGMIVFAILAVTVVAYFINKSTTGSLIFSALALLLFSSLGFFIPQLHHIENNQEHYFHHLSTSEALKVIQIEEKLKPNRYYHNYIAKVISVGSKTVEGEILLSIAKDSLNGSIAIGDRLLFNNPLEDIYEPLNPFQFNYRKFMKKRGIYKQAKLTSIEYFLEPNASFSFKNYAAHLKLKIQQRLAENGLSPIQLEITSALLLGERKSLDKTIQNDFTSAGVIHILAVSGLHIGLILWIITLVLKPLKRFKFGKQLIYFLSLLILWSYAFLIGFTPSVLRAVTMFSFVGFGLIFKRKGNTLNMLFLSALVLLIFNPNLIFEVGFQMSYLAVLGILAFQPILSRKLFVKNKIVRYFLNIIVVSVSAQIGVLPLSIFYFHQVPGLFLIANLAVLPALGILLGFGLVLIILSLSNFSIEFLVWLYGKCIDGLLWIIHQIALQQDFLLENLYFNKPMMFSAYLAILLLALMLHFKRKTYLFLFGASIILFQSLYLISFFGLRNHREFYVLHKTRESYFLKAEGRKPKLYTSDSLWYENTFIQNFKTELGLQEIETLNIKNIFSFNENKVLVIDSLGVYQISSNVEVSHLILVNSPKINLEKVIKEIQPEIIVADGSNYKSYVKRWKRTCLKQKVPFHYTGEKGAFTIKH